MRVFRFDLVRRNIPFGISRRKYFSTFPTTKNSVLLNDHSCRLAGKWCNKYSSENFSSIVSSFTASNDANYTNEKNSCFLQIDKISGLSDAELIEKISQVKDLFMKKENGFNYEEWKRIAHALDGECVRRGKEWEIDTALTALEAAFPKATVICEDLLYFLIKRKYRVIMKAPIPTTVRFLRLLTYYKPPTRYFTRWYMMEYIITKKFDEMSLDEISIFLATIHSLKGKITSQELITKLYARLLENFDKIEEPVLSRFLQFFCGQLKGNSQNVPISFDELLNNLEKRMNELQINTIKFIVTLCYHNFDYRPQLLDKIANELLNKLPNVPSSTLQEMIEAFTHLGYSCEDFYRKIIDSFKLEPLQSDIKSHPKRFIKTIASLSIIGIYPYEYINAILSEEFLHATFGKRLNGHSVSKETAIIHDCVEIECPDYNGNRLDKNLQRLLHECSASYLNYHFDNNNVPQKLQKGELPFPPSTYNKILLETRDMLTQKFSGIEFSHICYILPFLPRPNLLFLFDQNKNPIQIPPNISSSIRLNYQELDKNMNWYAVLVVPQDPILKENNYLILGKDIAKVRLLKKLGFNLVVIVTELWKTLDEKSRYNYLSDLIHTA